MASAVKRYRATRENRRQERRKMRAQGEASKRLSFGLAPFDVFASSDDRSASQVLHQLAERLTLGAAPLLAGGSDVETSSDDEEEEGVEERSGSDDDSSTGSSPRRRTARKPRAASPFRDPKPIWRHGGRAPSPAILVGDGTVARARLALDRKQRGTARRRRSRRAQRRAMRRLCTVRKRRSVRAIMSPSPPPTVTNSSSIKPNMTKSPPTVVAPKPKKLAPKGVGGLAGLLLARKSPSPKQVTVPASADNGDVQFGAQPSSPPPAAAVAAKAAAKSEERKRAAIARAEADLKAAQARLRSLREDDEPEAEKVEADTDNNNNNNRTIWRSPPSERPKSATGTRRNFRKPAAARRRPQSAASSRRTNSTPSGSTCPRSPDNPGGLPADELALQKRRQGWRPAGKGQKTFQRSDEANEGLRKLDATVDYLSERRAERKRKLDEEKHQKALAKQRALALFGGRGSPGGGKSMGGWGKLKMSTWQAVQEAKTLQAVSGKKIALSQLLKRPPRPPAHEVEARREWERLYYSAKFRIVVTNSYSGLRKMKGKWEQHGMPERMGRPRTAPEGGGGRAAAAGSGAAAVRAAVAASKRRKNDPHDPAVMQKRRRAAQRAGKRAVQDGKTAKLSRGQPLKKTATSRRRAAAAARQAKQGGKHVTIAVTATEAAEARKIVHRYRAQQVEKCGGVVSNPQAKQRVESLGKFCA